LEVLPGKERQLAALLLLLASNTSIFSFKGTGKGGKLHFFFLFLPLQTFFFQRHWL
jgi:hypothetical protein